MKLEILAHRHLNSIFCQGQQAMQWDLKLWVDKQPKKEYSQESQIIKVLKEFLVL